MGYLNDWSLTTDELEEILTAGPSLRGFLFGYVAEYKLKKLLLSNDRIKQIGKYDNHDRSKKGDVVLVYNGIEISVEVKSLQTHTIKEERGFKKARFQCDASDRRRVKLPYGRYIETTCLLVDEFDILAVNLFGFCKEWVFAFALNTDLPRSEYPKYTTAQKKYLLATTMEITWPVADPFSLDPFPLLDKIAANKSIER